MCFYILDDFRILFAIQHCYFDSCYFVFAKNRCRNTQICPTIIYLLLSPIERPQQKKDKLMNKQTNGHEAHMDKNHANSSVETLSGFIRFNINMNNRYTSIYYVCTTLLRFRTLLSKKECIESPLSQNKYE